MPGRPEPLEDLRAAPRASVALAPPVEAAVAYDRWFDSPWGHHAFEVERRHASCGPSGLSTAGASSTWDVEAGGSPPPWNSTGGYSPERASTPPCRRSPPDGLGHR